MLFQNVAAGTGFADGQAQVLIVAVGDDHNSSDRIKFSYLSGCCQPIHPRHSYVHENDIGPVIVVERQCVGSVVTLPYLSRSLVNFVSYEQADACIVFHNQNGHFSPLEIKNYNLEGCDHWNPYWNARSATPAGGGAAPIQDHA